MRRHRQIAILGFPGVGKSSLAHHFVYKHFNDVYDPNIKTNLQYQCVINGQEYDLTIVDNAGSDQYTLNHIDFENSDAYILVYAIDDLQSFQMISRIRDRIMSSSTITKIPIVLVGNKIDRTNERVVSSDEGRALANAWKVHFVETSALDFKAVKDIFEKSIKAMENIDTNESSTNSNPPEINHTSSSSSSSSNPPVIGKQVSSGKLFPMKQQSTNKTCVIS